MLPRPKRLETVKCNYLILVPQKTLGTGLQTPSRLALIIIHKRYLVPTRYAHRYTHHEVGRNKPVRAFSAGQVFPASRCRKHPPLLSPGGLRI